MAKYRILVPLEIPRDEVVLVTNVFSQNGEKVPGGAPIFEIETSKTSYLIEAEAPGLIFHEIVLGDELKSGQVIGYIESEI